MGNFIHCPNLPWDIMNLCWQIFIDCQYFMDWQDFGDVIMFISIVLIVMKDSVFNFIEDVNFLVSRPSKSYEN